MELLWKSCPIQFRFPLAPHLQNENYVPFLAENELQNVFVFVCVVECVNRQPFQKRSKCSLCVCLCPSLSSLTASLQELSAKCMQCCETLNFYSHILVVYFISVGLFMGRAANSNDIFDSDDNDDMSIKYHMDEIAACLCSLILFMLSMLHILIDGVGCKYLRLINFLCFFDAFDLFAAFKICYFFRGNFLLNGTFALLKNSLWWNWP